MKMQNIMEQAKKMQNKIKKMQDELADKEVEASVGGGMVKAVVNGKQQLLSLEIEKEVVDPEDVGMLQDLIVSAVNEALTKANNMAGSEMQKLTSGMGLPPGLL